MIKGLEPKVYLEPEKHVYYNKETGEEYLSVSKFLGLFKKSFDKNLAYSCAGKGEYAGMDASEVLSQWSSYGKERADEGTQIHNALELFSNTTEILPKNEYLRPGILNISSKYNGYYRQYNEVVLSDEIVKIAGTSDKVFLVNQTKDSPIDISDFKTNVKGINQVDVDKKGNPIHKYMLGPLSHLTDSKYNGYALQISVYAYMVEKKTGRKIRKLYIHYINPENLLVNYMIPLPYMKYEVMAMMDWYKNEYKSKPKIVSVPEPAPKSILSGFSNNAFLKDEFDLI